MASANFRWDLSRRIAAVRVADGTIDDDDIASEAGITDRQLRTWKLRPEFARFVDALMADAMEPVRNLLIADKSKRVVVLQDLLERQLRVVEERAANPDDATAGIRTGLLVRQWKKVGTGRDAEMVEEYAVDTGLVASIQATLKRGAEELGQIETKVTVKGTVRHDHRHRGLSALSDAELDQLEILADKIDAGTVAV